MSRAATPTLRNCKFISGVVRLPNVPTVVGSELGVAHHHLNRADRNPQFFGDGLGERCPDILPDLDLAGIHGDLPVFADVQPGADFFRKEAACATLVASA